ncbi:hypothetical protein EQO05_13765 [Methanosarcina sp. MSH10X1]|uniref:hypothetical protein n=1 Tax=Methanosarcina sp. MSH10X1 TaxID=2507075 RepID=UPI000FFB9407|nr:hypothetical protein [Methanosarcina sp. MSH10X1]RXA16577.1 hypothetical protein EQO05_13765 [Methanosarcina sp. MSH10X1]
MRSADLSRSGYTGFDKALVFDQTFFEKVCVAPVDHAVSWGFSLKPFLKRLALQQSLNQVQQLLNNLIGVRKIRFPQDRQSSSFPNTDIVFVKYLFEV